MRGGGQPLPHPRVVQRKKLLGKQLEAAAAPSRVLWVITRNVCYAVHGNCGGEAAFLAGSPKSNVF